MHKIDKVLDALVSVLDSALDIDVKRSPTYRNSESCLRVKQGSENTLDEGVLTNAEFELILDQVIADKSELLESIANDYRSQIQKALMAAQGTIDGLVSVGRPQVEEAQIHPEATVYQRRLTYSVHYRYNTMDPSL